MLISVIIVTIGRESLISTLKSIIKNNFKDLEIVIIEQKGFTENTSKKLLAMTRKFPIRVMKSGTSNLSYGRNLGIKKSRGKIVAFTDDDCIVSSNWLRQINKCFSQSRKLDVVFGSVFPYQAKKNIKLLIPGTVIGKKPKNISKVGKHWEVAGLGNNMSFRKKVFDESGYFRTWLGAGSITRSAEDAEFILRLIIHGKKMLYQPKVKVWHNRWLNEIDYKNLMINYDCGEIACYSYLFFNNYKFAGSIIMDNIKNSFTDIKIIIKNGFGMGSRRNTMSDYFLLLKSLFLKSLGLIVGLYYSITDPIIQIKPKIR